jgi:hypothetical protein
MSGNMEFILIHDGIASIHNIPPKNLPKELAVVKQVFYDINSGKLSILALDGRVKVIPLSAQYRADFSGLSSEEAQLRSLTTKVMQFVSPSSFTEMSAVGRVKKEFEAGQAELDHLNNIVQDLKRSGCKEKDPKLVAARKKRDDFLNMVFIPLLDKKNAILMKEQQAFKATEKAHLAKMKKEPPPSEEETEAKALARKIEYVKTLPDIPSDLRRGIEKYEEWDKQIDELKSKVEGSTGQKKKEINAEIKYLKREQQMYLLSYLAPMLGQIRIGE